MVQLKNTMKNLLSRKTNVLTAPMVEIEYPHFTTGLNTGYAFVMPTFVLSEEKSLEMNYLEGDELRVKFKCGAEKLVQCEVVETGSNAPAFELLTYDEYVEFENRMNKFW